MEANTGKPCLVVSSTESESAEIIVCYYLAGVTSPSLSNWIVPGTLYGV